jgi:hypothetical protein
LTFDFFVVGQTTNGRAGAGGELLHSTKIKYQINVDNNFRKNDPNVGYFTQNSALKTDGM